MSTVTTTTTSPAPAAGVTCPDATAGAAPRRVSERGAKIAAGILGITVEAYRAHEAADEYHCGRCRAWFAVDDFHRTNQSYGRGGYCRACYREGQRDRRWANALRAPLGTGRSGPSMMSRYWPTEAGIAQARPFTPREEAVP